MIATAEPTDKICQPKWTINGMHDENHSNFKGNQTFGLGMLIAKEKGTRRRREKDV
jgi:hypothetical protein